MSKQTSVDIISGGPGSSMSAPCTFFRIDYNHSEYEVFQTATLREGLLKILNNEDRLLLQARAFMSDDELLDYMFRLGAQDLRHAGWGLVAVVIGTTLVETPH